MPTMLAASPIPHPPIRILIGERVKSLPMSAGITRNENTCKYARELHRADEDEGEA